MNSNDEFQIGENLIKLKKMAKISQHWTSTDIIADAMYHIMLQVGKQMTKEQIYIAIESNEEDTYDAMQQEQTLGWERCFKDRIAT